MPRRVLQCHFLSLTLWSRRTGCLLLEQFLVPVRLTSWRCGASDLRPGVACAVLDLLQVYSEIVPSKAICVHLQHTKFASTNFVIPANIINHGDTLVHYHQKDASTTHMVFMQVVGAAVNLRARSYKPAVAPGDVGLVTLRLRPVRMHLHIANNNQLIDLIKQLLITLTALHKQNWVHRDACMDNWHGPTGWILIGWELAAVAGTACFLEQYTPPSTGERWPDALHSSMRLVASRQDHPAIQYNALSSEAMKHFTNQLTSKHFEFVEHALHVMPEV